RLDKARLLWDAAQMRLAGVQARMLDSDATIVGDAEVSLLGHDPHIKFDGRVTDLPYKGGKLDFDGSFETEGLDARIIESAHAEGSVRGRAVSFAPEAEFRTAVACFQLQGLQWKLADIEVVQGGDTYTGSGASQGDGKLVLDLTRSGGRKWVVV